MLGHRRKTPRFHPLNRNIDIQGSLGLKNRDLAQHQLCHCKICERQIPTLSAVNNQYKIKLCGYPSYLETLMKLIIHNNKSKSFRKAGLWFPTTCFFQQGKIKYVSEYSQDSLVFTTKSQLQTLKLLKRQCSHWIAVTKRGYLKRLICLQQLIFYLTPNNKSNPLCQLLYIQKYPNSPEMLDSTISTKNGKKVRAIKDRIESSEDVIPFLQQYFSNNSKISIQKIQLIVSQDERSQGTLFWIKDCLHFQTKAFKKVGFTLHQDVQQIDIELGQILIKKMAGFYEQSKLQKNVFTDFKFCNQDQDSNRCFNILYPQIHKTLSEHLNVQGLELFKKANSIQKKRVRTTFLTQKSVCKSIRTTTYRKHSLV